MWELAVPAGIGVIAIFGIGFMFASLYPRSTRDEAYVRTGLGGQKVVLDGGSVVLPIFHSIAAVNLKTLRLEVARGEGGRADHQGPHARRYRRRILCPRQTRLSSIALAAQTLGDRTNDAEELRELIEAKFVDGLRSVAATMNLDALQEQRTTFVKAVQEAVGADLQNNGLELESVSLTRLDQTDIKHFNANNFFDAHGLTTLTRITKERKQERNEIVRDTEVAIAQKDLVARQTTLTIERTKREAELTQQRDIANKTAAMRAQTAQVEQTRAAERGRIPHRAGTGGRQQADRSQAGARHRQDRGRSRGQAPHHRNGARPADRGAGERDRRRQQEHASNPKRRPSPRPRARWPSPPRKRSRPPRAIEIAERDKIINVIEARKAAETEATPITVRRKPKSRPPPTRRKPSTCLRRPRPTPRPPRATGVKALGQAEAEVAALNEARNKLSAADHRVRSQPRPHQHHSEALAEAVKPIEKISDIRIFDTGGMLGRGGGDGAAGTGGGGNLGLGDGLASQLLSVSAFKPIIDKILTEAGFAAGPDAADQPHQRAGRAATRHPVEPPAAPVDSTVTPPTSISGTGKATLGPKS